MIQTITLYIILSLYGLVLYTGVHGLVQGFKNKEDE